MRRFLIPAIALAVAATSVPHLALAQGRDRGDDQRQEEAAAKKRKQKEEWSDVQAPLPQLRNAGPCPFVKVLYDAARYTEFKEGREASANVGYTGEVQGISATCSYKDAEPIDVAMQVLFELGKGPQAEGRTKSYRYWVAVTQRNQSVITKQFFDLPVTFPEGQDRVYITDKINHIIIPRAAMTTSGANFEVLIGFDVTPQMAAFNREGKRFRVNVGAVAAAGDAAARQ
ncbi:Tat pathway signal sequence domain protein [Phenylobacterium sp.]|uniref:Tat pathway signal sequence domain protein n=1 Tax=Phenylobacterium sp. TaxID=1871053 RepID=UPI002736AACA|nr:Tat pathway signal sequence domain protein [Phenylobacterium sp.]MDP3658782.1 Tat pathway signal sequence domain protein [Phenylobacterium sp.]